MPRWYEIPLTKIDYQCQCSQLMSPISFSNPKWALRIKLWAMLGYYKLISLLSLHSISSIAWMTLFVSALCCPFCLLGRLGEWTDATGSRNSTRGIELTLWKLAYYSMQGHFCPTRSPTTTNFIIFMSCQHPRILLTIWRGRERDVIVSIVWSNFPEPWSQRRRRKDRSTLSLAHSRRRPLMLIHQLLALSSTRRACWRAVFYSAPPWSWLRKIRSNNWHNDKEIKLYSKNS